MERSSSRPEERAMRMILRAVPGEDCEAEPDEVLVPVPLAEEGVVVKGFLGLHTRRPAARGRVVPAFRPFVVMDLAADEHRILNGPEANLEEISPIRMNQMRFVLEIAGEFEVGAVLTVSFDGPTEAGRWELRDIPEQPKGEIESKVAAARALEAQPPEAPAAAVGQDQPEGGEAEDGEFTETGEEAEGPDTGAADEVEGAATLAASEVEFEQASMHEEGEADLFLFNSPRRFPALFRIEHHWDRNHLNLAGASLFSRDLAVALAPRLAGKTPAELKSRVRDGGGD